MKKITTVILVIALVISLSVSAFAISHLTLKGSAFTGHAELLKFNDSDDTIMRLSITDDGDFTDELPILTYTEEYTDCRYYTWTDQDGELDQPVTSPAFTLTAVNGDIKNLGYQLQITGDTRIANALRYNLTIDDGETYVCTDDTFTPRAGTEGYAEDAIYPLGSTEIPEGKTSTSTFQFWLDETTMREQNLTDLGEFAIEVLFIGESAE